MNPPSIPFIAGSAALPLYLRGLAIKYYSPERARPSLIPPCLLPSSSISLSCPHKMTTPSLPSISLPLPIAPQSPRLDCCRPVPSLSPFGNQSPALSIPYRSARVLQFRFVDPLYTSPRVSKSFLNTTVVIQSRGGSLLYCQAAGGRGTEGPRKYAPRVKGGSDPFWPEPSEEEKIVSRGLLLYGLEASAPQIGWSTRWWQRSPIEPYPFRGLSSIRTLTGIISTTLEKGWWCCDLPLPWTPPP